MAELNLASWQKSKTKGFKSDKLDGLLKTYDQGMKDMANLTKVTEKVDTSKVRSTANGIVTVCAQMKSQIDALKKTADAATAKIMNDYLTKMSGTKEAMKKTLEKYK